MFSGKSWRTNVPGEQNHLDFTEAAKWSGNQVSKNAPGGQMSGELMTDCQKTILESQF